MIVQQQSIGGFIIKYTENSAFVMRVWESIRGSN